MSACPWKQANVIRTTLRLLLAVLLVTGAAAGVLLAASPARAIDLDGIKVTPKIGYTGEYDDNVFRSRYDKRSDYINHLQAGIELEAKPGKHLVKAGYNVDVLRYSTHNNLDTERHYLDFLLNLNFNRTQLRFSDSFKRTDEFPTSQITQRIRRNQNDLGAGFDFDMAQIWGIGFDYGWDTHNYLDVNLDNLDRNRHTVAPYLYYKLTGKTKALFEYNFAREVYDSGVSKARDNSRHRALVGLRGEITERFKVTAKAGWEGLYYNQNTLDDFNAGVFSLEMNYQPVERLGLAVILDRKTDPSTFGANGHYETLSSTFLATYALTPKITLIPRVSLGWDYYPEKVANVGGNRENRSDINLGAGLGLRYEIQKWARLELNYDYAGRQSNFDGFEYDDNRVFFKVGFQM